MGEMAQGGDGVGGSAGGSAGEGCLERAISREPSQDGTLETAQARWPRGEMAREAAQEVAWVAAQEVAREAAQEAAWEAAQEAAQEVAQEAVRARWRGRDGPGGRRPRGEMRWEATQRDGVSETARGRRQRGQGRG